MLYVQRNALFCLNVLKGLHTYMYDAGLYELVLLSNLKRGIQANILPNLSIPNHYS